MTHERFHPIIGLRYKDIQNVKEIVNEIKLFLLKYPHIDQNASIDVSLMNFGAYALEIEVSAFVLTTCGTNFKSIRQDLLLNIAEIVSAAGGEITNNNNQTIEISGPSPYQLPVVPHSSFMNRS
jgi:small-conductance mechanosensitive channel